MVSPRSFLSVLVVLALAPSARADTPLRDPRIVNRAVTTAQVIEVTQDSRRATEGQIDTPLGQRLAAISALNDDRCDEALNYFKIRDGEDISTDWIVLRAQMHWRGQCFAQDSAEAARVLQLAIDDRPRFEKALALPGALYWRGDGVPQDRGKAQALFRSAMLNLGPKLIIDDYRTAKRYGQSAVSGYWGLTDVELERAFTTDAAGPWDLPEPLKQQLAWFDGIKDDGAGILAVALALRTGSDGFPKDPPLAFQWMEAASFYMGHVPAHVPYAIWLRDEALFALRLADNESLIRGRARLISSPRTAP